MYPQNELYELLDLELTQLDFQMSGIDSTKLFLTAEVDGYVPDWEIESQYDSIVKTIRDLSYDMGDYELFIHPEFIKIKDVLLDKEKSLLYVTIEFRRPLQ